MLRKTSKDKFVCDRKFKKKVEMLRNTKNAMKSFGLMLAALLSLSSCQREVTEVYAFTYDATGLSLSGGRLSVRITESFLNSAGWNDVKKYENEAYSDKNARNANEKDALVDFDYKLANFDKSLPSLYEEYGLAGVDSASGKVILRLSCVSEERVVKESSRDIFYTASSDTVALAGAEAR